MAAPPTAPVSARFRGTPRESPIARQSARPWRSPRTTRCAVTNRAQRKSPNVMRAATSRVPRRAAGMPLMVGREYSTLGLHALGRARRPALRLDLALARGVDRRGVSAARAPAPAGSRGGPRALAPGRDDGLAPRRPCFPAPSRVEPRLRGRGDHPPDGRAPRLRGRGGGLRELRLPPRLGGGRALLGAPPRALRRAPALRRRLDPALPRLHVRERGDRVRSRPGPRPRDRVRARPRPRVVRWPRPNGEERGGRP